MGFYHDSGSQVLPVKPLPDEGARGRVFSDWGGCSRVASERGGAGSRDCHVTPRRYRTVMGRPIRCLVVTGRIRELTKQ
eukprot:1965683-Rhodomonas_salina.1